METKCRTGQTIIYDTVGKLGWGVDIRTHRIAVLIDKLLIPNWDKDADKDIQGKVYEDGLTAAHEIGPNVATTSWHWPWSGKKGKKKKNKKQKDGDSNHTDPDDRPDEEPIPSPPPPAKKRKSHVPVAEVDKECTDCFKWEFFDDDGSGSGNGSSSVLESGLAFDLHKKRSKCW